MSLQETLNELMDADMRREINRRAIRAVETQGLVWPRLNAGEKDQYRQTAFAEMLEEALQESDEFEKLADGRWTSKAAMEVTE